MALRADYQRSRDLYDAMRRALGSEFHHLGMTPGGAVFIRTWQSVPDLELRRFLVERDAEGRWA